MIYVFYGTDRLAAERAAEKILGPIHETIDAEDLNPADLPTIFLGQTFFESERKLLLKDFFIDKTLAAELEKYLDTPHEVVILEQTIDKRQNAYKDLSKDSRLKFQEFKLPEFKVDHFLAFNVFDDALRDGKKAVQKLRPAEVTESPYLIIGAWASRAIKNYLARPTPKNKRILKELARIDVMLKSTKFAENPWPVLETFLLRLQNL